ncbi:complement C1q tumor necrosis factor-related protein 4-like [Diadema setosum]|uniref:complement C1q tumor necrosis factor-related protein 4-like n=1 Tax=Diadema setosum TaxID=31175 RepID=UPI003B3ACC04
MLSWVGSVMGLSSSLEAGTDPQGSSAFFSVAFTSVLEGGLDPQRVPFDRILSCQPESAFSTEDSQFTCPIPGSYFFTFTIHPDEGKAASVCLKKNEDSVVMLYAHKNKRGPSTSSQSAILDLQPGDVVWLELQSGNEYAIRSHPGTPLVTFTGILVKSQLTD